MSMRQLEPKRKYECALCGTHSANDQIPLGGLEFCPGCAEKPEALIEVARLQTKGMAASLQTIISEMRTQSDVTAAQRRAYAEILRQQAELLEAAAEALEHS